MRYFHGLKYRKNWFEGWYFKHQKGNKSLAFIPSVCVDENGKATAVLQILNNEKSWQFSYPLCEFNSEEDQLSIRMDNSYFTERGCTLNIKTDDVTIKGRIEYGPLLMLNKDIMGPFRFMPKMECHHGIISLYHTLEGKIEIDQETWDLDGGIGYIEMDWGSSFPKSYVWTQCLWKDETENSIMVAAAMIPCLKMNFKGCIGCVMVNGKHVVLATYFGAKVMQMNEEVLVIHQKSLRLEVHYQKGNPIKLKAVEQGKLIHDVYENLVCTVHYRLFENNECVLDVVREDASFEAFIH